MELRMNKKIPLESELAPYFEERNGEQRALRSIVESRINFSETLPVSKKSKYGDSVWSWEDNSNPRLKAYSRSNLVIDWEHFGTLYNLTPSIIDDLKKYAFFRLNYSIVVFPDTMKNDHPYAVVEQVRVFSRFLSHLRLSLSVGEKSLINKLSDIEVQDLRDCLENYPGRQDSRLKPILSNLASETLSRHFDCGVIKWNKQDVASLPWKKRKPVPYERLPEKLFSFLSNNATADVKQFLKALKIKTQDKSPIGGKPNIFLQSFSNFDCVFERYVKYRNDLWEKDRYSATQFVLWARRVDVRIGQIEHLVERARYAARIIIMLYTGARHSEYAGFKLNCLRRKDENWVIAGTVIKHRDINAPSEKDEWVAIPIVRDAVHALKELARVVNSEFLFHNTYILTTVKQDFLDSDQVSQGVRKYIDFVDAEGEWEGVKPHPQQFRNSLAFEMRKASLGLPFITYQLKHAYNAIERTISDTTLGYGSIGSNAVHKAIADAHLAVLSEIYHPDSPVSGGGAEQHKKRREAYFEGMVHRGMTIDEVLLHLAVEGGMPLTDVGLGYCQGQGAKIMVDGVKTDPPCTGGLRCNPVVCRNAIIPKHKLPAWEKSLAENQARADDPAFAYARPQLLGAADEARSVVEFFQIQGRSGKKSE